MGIHSFFVCKLGGLMLELCFQAVAPVRHPLPNRRKESERRNERNSEKLSASWSLDGQFVVDEVLALGGLVVAEWLWPKPMLARTSITMLWACARHRWFQIVNDRDLITNQYAESLRKKVYTCQHPDKDSWLLFGMFAKGTLNHASFWTGTSPKGSAIRAPKTSLMKLLCLFWLQIIFLVPPRCCGQSGLKLPVRRQSLFLHLSLLGLQLDVGFVFTISPFMLTTIDKILKPKRGGRANRAWCIWVLFR